MAPRRKCPFSGKAKKEQLKEKKVKNQSKRRKKANLPFLRNSHTEESDDEPQMTVKLNHQPSKSNVKNNSRDVNRYVLQFYKESKAEINDKKLEAQKSLQMVGEKEMEIDSKDFFPQGIDFPRRPPWNFNMSRDELNAREHRYFTEFVKKIENEFGSKNLSYFELNLETWRQLWRVLEMSDIVLIIVDVRFAVFMFPPTLYKYVCEELKKDMILVLNKIDLVPPELIVAWKHYFLQHYPTLKIVTFTSLPSYNLRNVNENKSGLKNLRRKCKPQMAAEGAQKLYEACNEITEGQVDLSCWADKIKEQMKSNYVEDETQIKIVTEVEDTGYQEHTKYQQGTLTIGCIGQPNVGKSSLMNAIMGKKVVSVSRTPGHTKHFQTIYLTKNVILCDCPGLVFPSKIQRTIQILNGAYPIAQVREPYMAVKYLAERLDLPRLLGIQHPENDDTWSAIDICDGWAKKRGFFTAKTARPDTYRAANSILRMSLEGKICLFFKPPGYQENKEHWKNHPEVADVAWIQAKYKNENDGIKSEGESENESFGDESDSPGEETDNSDETDPMPKTSNRFQLLEET
ncbi:hypothetical protein RUM44_009789 [Polyplax serrata]|uniref:Guanine nucleotide-binding protein-like 1 n=1 Tax=Polyplax serrata TaxID=468196 RepID=A0ABR1ATP5_POLSC